MGCKTKGGKPKTHTMPDGSKMAGPPMKPKGKGKGR